MWAESTHISVKKKKSPENRHKKNLLQHNKSIYDKTTANIMFNDEKLKDQEENKDVHFHHYYST